MRILSVQTRIRTVAKKGLAQGGRVTRLWGNRRLGNDIDLLTIHLDKTLDKKGIGTKDIDPRKTY